MAARETERRSREEQRQHDENFCLAANRGDPFAQASMGVYYSRGWTPEGRDGIDRVQAYVWYGLAARNGFPGAAKHRDDQKRILPDEEIARAETLLATWTPDPAACAAFAGRTWPAPS